MMRLLAGLGGFVGVLALFHKPQQDVIVLDLGMVEAMSNMENMVASKAELNG